MEAKEASWENKTNTSIMGANHRKNSEIFFHGFLVFLLLFDFQLCLFGVDIYFPDPYKKN